MRARIWVATVALVVGAQATALAVCNLIPAAARTFPSTDGSEVSTPFGFPCPRGREFDCRAEGQVVTVRRADEVFSGDPAGNTVVVRFSSADGRPIVAQALAPLAGSRC